MIEIGKEKQAETEKRNRDRKERLRKKSELESKWEMLRWVINFIDNNKDGWEKERKEREKVEMETIRMWEKKTREEKIDQIVTEKIKATPFEESLWRKIRMKSAGGRGGDKQEVARLSVANADEQEVMGLSVANAHEQEVTGLSVANSDEQEVTGMSMENADEHEVTGLSVANADEQEVTRLSLANADEQEVTGLSVADATHSQLDDQEQNLAELSMAGLSEGPTSVQGAVLGGKEQNYPSEAKLRFVKCADCRRRMRRIMGWRVSNMVRMTRLSEIGPSDEQIRLDEQFPENFSEIVSSEEFKTRKKSLLRKKINELRKKLQDQLPGISEVEEVRVEELSVKPESEPSLKKIPIACVRTQDRDQNKDDIMRVGELSASLDEGPSLANQGNDKDEVHGGQVDTIGEKDENVLMRVGGPRGLSLENKGGDKDGIRGGHQGIGDKGGEGVQGEPNVSHDELADEQSELNMKVNFLPDGLVNFLPAELVNFLPVGLVNVLPDELVNQSDLEISSNKNEIQCAKK